jgi:glucokinase
MSKNPSTLIFAADIGGTRIKLGLVDVGAFAVLARETIPAIAGEGVAARLPFVVEAWLSCAKSAGIDPSTVTRVGMGLPCAISADGSSVLGTPAGKFTDAPQFDFAKWAADHGWQIRMENDARCALAGEMVCGSLKNHPNVAMVTLGTGIGVAVAVGGKILRGAGQGSLMFAHMAQASGPECICGRRGCAEARAGGWAFQRDGLPWPGPQRAEALEVWAQVLDAICTAYDPTHITMGGGLVAADQSLINDLQTLLDRQPRLAGKAPTLVTSALGESGPLLGASVITQIAP